MTDTTGNINGKGLDGTGITEAMLEDLFDKVGTHLVAIVDLQVVDKHGPNLKGKRKISLSIDSIEPATTDDLAEHLRELTRTLNFNRGHGHQPVLPGYDEPTVEGVLASGSKFRPHPFLPVDAADDQPICDVCGLIQTAAVHSAQDVLPDGDDEPELDEGDEGDEEAADERADVDAEQELVADPDPADPDPADEPTLDENFPAGLPNHPYVTGCCDRPQTSRIHTPPTERHLAPVPADPFTP